MNNNLIDNRFRQAMIPALWMGVVTNIYIAVVVAYVDVYEILISPVLSTFLFLIYFLLLKKNRITPKQSFLIVAYTVVIEITIHSYFLGWGMGFYYYMFLLPIIFLLNSSWKTWMIVFFNASIALSSVLIWCYIYRGTPIYSVNPEIESYINLFNLTGTGIIILVIMIYFSRTINKKDEALIEANYELERQNKEIIGQHSNLEILLKEVHHRVKNNLQIISSLMSLERNQVENKEVIAILNESKRRVEAIALIHQKLYQDEKFNRVDFKSYMEELMGSQMAMNSNLKCVVESEDAVLSLDTAVPLGLIISEMITNSIKHAFDGIDSPELKVKLTSSGEDYKLIVHDNGVGLSEDFNLDNPISLGTEIINALTEQIGARIEFFNDNGAKFIIYFKN